jgi:hypothetical protein
MAAMNDSERLMESNFVELLMVMANEFIVNNSGDVDDLPQVIRTGENCWKYVYGGVEMGVTVAYLQLH